MTLLRSPRNKLIVAGAAVLALALLAPMQGASAATVARVLLAAAGIAVFTWWLLRMRVRPDVAFTPEVRLRVLSRTGLSQRCGMALVEADGRNYLVVFGDGFAELHEAPRPRTEGAL